MAAIKNLEVVVSVDISDAISSLKHLQDELENVADEISQLRRQGDTGVDVRTHVDSIKDDLAQLRLEIEKFEDTTSIDIDTDVGSVGAAAAASRAGGGGGVPSFNRPFLAEGSRAAASIDDISAGMGNLFGDDRGEDSRLSRIMSSLADEFSDVRQSIDDFDLRMSDLHNMLARIVPLLFVFIGAIPAVVTALMGLAAAAVAAGAALLALGGFGAIGFAMDGGEFDSQRLSDALSDLRDDFLDAFAPLANQLQPLFEDALAGLESFFTAVANQGDALLALEGEARAFGQFLLDFIPNMLRTAAALVEGMSDVFGGIGGFLEANFASVIQSLLVLTREIMPVLALLAQRVAGMLPPLARLSLGFLQVVNGIVFLIDVLGTVLSLLPISSRAFGVATAATLAFATAVLLSRSALLTMAYNAIVGAISSLYNLAVAFVTTSIASAALTKAVAALITVLSLGTGLALIGGLSALTAGFVGLTGSIGDATDALKDFQSVQNGMDGSGFGSGDGNPYGFDPDDPRDGGPRGGGNVTVFNVESSGDAKEDRSNLEHADWLSGRTTTT